jgi:hypothetical protein
LPLVAWDGHAVLEAEAYGGHGALDRVVALRGKKMKKRKKME